jgi:hypothetical protein
MTPAELKSWPEPIKNYLLQVGCAPPSTHHTGMLNWHMQYSHSKLTKKMILHQYSNECVSLTRLVTWPYAQHTPCIIC